MNMLARDPLVRFLGYNVKYGRAGGTLNEVPEHQLLEMPVAEGLMAGVAIGMSIKGYRPVLFFERSDFLLNGSDAIINHLCKIRDLSNGEFAPACIIRVVVGNRKKPLFTGAPHVQNFCDAFRMMVMPEVMAVCEAKSPDTVSMYYRQARDRQLLGKSTMIFEMKDLI